VVVDVVVRGPDGKPVAGLTESDFKVFENGKPQSVRAFEFHSPENDRSALPPRPAQLPDDTFVNLETTPASGPAVVVLLDFLNTPVVDQPYARAQIVEFLEHKPASMPVAIFALSDNLSLLQGFTTDNSKLLAAMRSKAAGMHMPAGGELVLKAQVTLDAFAAIGKFLSAFDGRKNLLWFSESFASMTLPSAETAEQGTLIAGSADTSSNVNSGPTQTGLTGNVVPAPLTLDSAGPSADELGEDAGNMTVLSERLRKVAITLAVSQTAVYPIDVRGLATDPVFSAAQAPPTALSTDPLGRLGTPGMPVAPGEPPAAGQQHNNFILSMGASQATMTEIADATGGRAYMNSNGVAAAAEQAVTDGATYYTLIYAPSNLNFDGGLRAIHVVLDKRGCSLSYRSAYYAVDPTTVAPSAADDRLASAMLHGEPDAQGLLFKAQIDRLGTPIPAPSDSPLAVQQGKHNRVSGQLSGMVQEYVIRLAVLANQLQTTELPSGRHRADLEIEVAGYAANGRKLGGTRQNLEVAIPPVAYERARSSGLFHSLHIALPVESSSLRVAVFDSGSHRTGSLEVPLPLPLRAQANAAPASAGHQ
jgi:VWFA-related protein